MKKEDLSLLVLLILLLLGMLFTLLEGRGTSRHGYGSIPFEAETIVESGTGDRWAARSVFHA